MAEDNRRDALKIIGAIGTTCAFPFSADELYGQHAHPAPAPAPVPPPAGPRFFTELEFRVVSRLADLIIPDTNTPGAVKAGVPAYIDSVVARSEQWQKLYRDGIAWLDGQCRRRYSSSFLELAEVEQVKILTPLCEQADHVVEAPAGSNRRTRQRATAAGVAFFRAVKSMTADGYYTSATGLIEELGYRGSTVLAEFPTCVHEH